MRFKNTEIGRASAGASGARQGGPGRSQGVRRVGGASLDGRLLVMIGLAFVVIASFTAYGGVKPMDVEEMIQSAQHIVVVTPISEKARWNEKHNLIHTDYLLLVEDRLKGEKIQELTISVAGGTIDAETHHTSVTIHLEVGARYLVFLDDIERPQFSPFIGGWQGVVRERAGLEAGDSTHTKEVSPQEFADLVESVRALIPVVEESAPSTAPPPPSKSEQEPDLPSKTYDPTDRRFKAEDVVDPLKAPTADAPERPREPKPEAMPPDAVRAGDTQRRWGTKYHWERRPDPFIAWNPFPLDWSWSPHDQYMMSAWNTYGDVNRVATPTGTWAWQNDVFDLAGWPSEQEMIDQFGEGWGATTLAITWSRWFGTGNIVEADIALNPSYSWTLDNEYGSRSDTTAWGFEQTMLHELGHGWGLKHPWEYQDVWWDSVMNYSPKRYRLPGLFTDDTQAVRTAYPGISIHDGLISCYITQDTTASNSATYVASVPETGGSEYPPHVAHESSIWLSESFKIENAGTDSFVNPSVEVYLTPLRMGWASSRYLATKNYTTTIPPFNTHYFSMGSATVPASVPTGIYYLGLYLRDATDGALRNNSAWSPYGERVRVIHCYSPPTWDTAITASAGWQVAGTHVGDEGGCLVYRVYLRGDGRYDFSVCPNDGVGGSADPGDGDFRMYDSSGTMLWYIDGSSSCGFDASTLGTAYEGWSPPSSGYYYVRVSDYIGGAMTHTLAYRQQVHCVTPPVFDSALSIGPSWQTTGGIALAANDCWIYRFYLHSSRSYDFSVCGNDGVGGSTDPGDGDFRMYDSGGTLLWYIDGASTCGYDASTLGTAYEGWSPPSDGYYYLKVSDYFGNGITFSLAHREEDVLLGIFEDGFESGDTSTWSSTVP